MMVRDGVTVMRKTHPIVVMGQAIDSACSRRECHGYRRRNESKHSKSGHRNRDTEADASPECCQHAAELVIVVPTAILGSARIRGNRTRDKYALPRRYRIECCRIGTPNTPASSAARLRVAAILRNRRSQAIQGKNM
jgi:hypothetical protein